MGGAKHNVGTGQGADLIEVGKEATVQKDPPTRVA